MPPAEQDLMPDKTERLLTEDLAAESAQTEGKETAAATDGTPSELLMEKTEDEEQKKSQSDDEEEKKPRSDGDERKMQSDEDEKKPPSEEEKLPAKVGDKKPPAKVRPHRGDRYTLGVPDPEATLFCNLALMVLLSLLYAGLTPRLLRRVADQPTAIVWTCSLIAGSYMSLWTMALSMEFFKTFFRSTYFLLLALTATHYVGPESGAAIASLGTFFAAGMFGYAIAKHRQRAGSEKSAGLVITPFLGIEEEKRRDEFFFSTKFMQSIVTLFVLQRMIWVILRPADKQTDRILFVVEELSLETTLLAWLWADFVVLILLEGALVSMHTMIFKGPACVLLLYMLSVVISVAAGETTGLLVLSPIPVAMSGFLGYCLAVYSRYKETGARFGANSLSPYPQKMAKLCRTNSA